MPRTKELWKGEEVAIIRDFIISNPDVLLDSREMNPMLQGVLDYSPRRIYKKWLYERYKMGMPGIGRARKDFVGQGARMVSPPMNNNRVDINKLFSDFMRTEVDKRTHDLQEENKALKQEILGLKEHLRKLTKVRAAVEEYHGATHGR